MKTLQVDSREIKAAQNKNSNLNYDYLWAIQFI